MGWETGGKNYQGFFFLPAVITVVCLSHIFLIVLGNNCLLPERKQLKFKMTPSKKENWTEKYHVFITTVLGKSKMTFDLFTFIFFCLNNEYIVFNL